MRKKYLKVVSLVAVSSMIMASITGCGMRAKATDEEIMEEETIIATDEDASEDVTINTEDEITETEEVIADSEEEAETEGEETVGGNIIFYTEWIGLFSDRPSDNFEFEAIDEEATVEDDVIVCQAGGREVGYIKGGTTIRLIEHGINSGVYRVENVSGVGYEYVYITDDDLLTLNDMKEFVARHLEGELSTIIDTPESDMEYIEFTIEKSQRSGVEDYIWESLYNDNFNCYDYNTFCVECVKNDKLIDVRVYYK